MNQNCNRRIYNQPALVHNRNIEFILKHLNYNGVHAAFSMQKSTISIVV